MSVAAPLRASEGKRRAGPAGLEIGQGDEGQAAGRPAGFLYDDGWRVGSGFLDGGFERGLERCGGRTAASGLGMKFQGYRAFAVDGQELGVRAVRFQKNADGVKRFEDTGAQILRMQAI